MIVRLPRAVKDAPTVVIEPLNSTVVIVGCASLPVICAPIADICRDALVNNFDKSIEILACFPVASVIFVRPVSKSSQAAATVFRLPHESKLRQVLHELKIDLLPDTAPHKQQLFSLVAMYVDIFAEFDSDVGTTKLTFHKINTGDVRPHRQPIRRVLYGEIPVAVEFEVDKLVSADIARASTSPLASPVVMIRKTDVGWWMCLDYRRLNSVTKFDCFLLQRLDEALDALACATVISNLDLAMAYH